MTTCAKATLVEALRDGRLGPQESASVERHLATCAECAELGRDIDRIGAALRAPRLPATPLEHQRARVALLERAALAPVIAPSHLRRPLFIVMAAAMLVIVGAVGWTAGRATAPPAQPMIALHVPGPPRLSPATETTIRSSDDASFERTRSAGVEVVTLSRGTLDVTLRALGPGERFVVRTKDAEIEVRGTAFRVEAEGGLIRGVAVAEGSVEVRYAGFAAVIPSGGSWRATAAPATPAEPAAAPPAAAATVASRAAAARAPRRAARRMPAEAHGTPAVAPAPGVAESPPPPAPQVAPSPPQASRDFAAAMAAIGGGDYGRAAAQLGAFSAAHPTDARADEADYLEAVALQRAGRSAEATAAARRYLAARANGAHRPEARLIAGD